MMKRVFDLWILIHWYLLLFSSISAASSYFIFDKDPFQKVHYVNDTFSIDGTFQLKCYDSQCLTNLNLSLKNDHKILIDLWCDSPATLLAKKTDGLEQPACVLDGIDAVDGEYRFSVSVRAHTVGSFGILFSAIFPNNPDRNQDWSSEDIVILNSSMDDHRSVQQSISKRKKRQDNITLDDTNVQPMISQDDDGISTNDNQIQTTPASDTSNVMKPPIQLNTYTGVMNVGHTADLRCNGPNSCPNYPKVDEQGRLVCCFLLPQVPDGATVLSSVVYQSGAQNLNDFQVNVDNGQSFNAANDLSVFLGSTIATSQCNVILPAETTQADDAQFRLTWTYYPNSTNMISPPPIKNVSDGTLPINILTVTSASTFAQQTDQFNEWFICPPSQNGRISLLRSIALLAGNNIDYFRCTFVTNQGIPQKDPTNDQPLLFTSSQSSADDNPIITSLPDLHTDCIAVQFFPNNQATLDLTSVILSITVAFQTAPTTDVVSVMPQVSDLQGTFQGQVDISVDISPINNDKLDDIRQTTTQTPSSTVIKNSSDDQSISCSPYQFDVPMSFNFSIGEYTGGLDIDPQILQSMKLDSVVVTGSSAVQNPITILFVDSQGNTLSEPFRIDLGHTVENDLQIVISKIILRATPLQDAAMDSSLHAQIVVCPQGTGFADPSLLNSSTLITTTPAYTSSQSPQSPPSISVDSSINCQERAESTYGTYPPDLVALTAPTQKPIISNMTSKTSSGTDVTPPTPNADPAVQMPPDYIYFNAISFSNNPFLHDIQVSASDYTNSMQCLLPGSGCSINFTSTKQPKIIFLFTTNTCISSITVPSPSNVHLFSVSIFDENGNQIRLTGAVDDRGTLLSSSGADPTVQMSPYSCGYSIILQLLVTNDKGPPTGVKIDASGYFRNSSALTTTITPSSSSAISNDFSTSSSQQVSSSTFPDAQSALSTSSPTLAPQSETQSYPTLSSSPSLLPTLPLEQQSLPSIQTTLVPSVFYETITISSPILQPSASSPSSFQTILSSPILVTPPSVSPSPSSSSILSTSLPPLSALPAIGLSQQPALLLSPAVQPPSLPSLQETTVSHTPSLAVTPPMVHIFQPVSKEPTPQSIAPVSPSMIPQTTAPSSQTSAMPTTTCPQITLTTHPGVELILFSDGTNVTSDLDPGGKGCNLVFMDSTMTAFLRTGMSAIFSSVGVSSSNVNQIEVALFDEASNRSLSQSPQGTQRSPLSLNPNVQNLPLSPAATLAVTFLSTVDGQPPRDVILFVYACFPTIRLISPPTAMTQSTNTFSEQSHPPTNPVIQTYPSYEQNRFPTNICIDSFQPSRVTSVANITLPPEYSSSNQCVCICQSSITVPRSSGVIQYHPSAQKIATQRRRKRQMK